MPKFTLNLLPEEVSDDFLLTLGISRERGTELKDISCDALDIGSEEEDISPAHSMRYIVERCETLEEVAATCYLLGKAMGMQDGMDSNVEGAFLKFLKRKENDNT